MLRGTYGGAVVIPAFNEERYLPYALTALANQKDFSGGERHAVVVIDNNSTDYTRKVSTEFMGRCGMFEVHVVAENMDTGPGPAADTGFRYAIDQLGVPVIARIDADTIPFDSWYGSLFLRHRRDSKLALLTGPVLPEHPVDMLCPLDNLIFPASKFVGQLSRAVQYRSIGMLHYAPGHNMSTTAWAYDTVGGFERKSMAEASEDRDYSLKVARTFGARTIGWEPNMVVSLSQRRIRALGYLRTALYYANPRWREWVAGESLNIR